MKTIPITLLNHYKQTTTTLCILFKLVLRDGTKLGFTTADFDIVLQEEPDLKYLAYSGVSATAVTSNSDFSVDNLNVDGFIENDVITEADVNSGRYDYADCFIYEMNYTDKPFSNTKLNIKRVGKLGQITISNKKFVAEIRGLLQFAQNNVGMLYQATCRANLGDSKCKVDLTPYTFNATVVSINSQNNFITTTGLSNADDYFTNGALTFTSGLNIGLTSEVKSWQLDGNEITLNIPANYRVAVGDTFKIIRGCNKLFTTCRDGFGNNIRFRGEPYVPQTPDLVNS